MGFRNAVTRWPWAPLFATPIGFAIAVYFMTRFFPNTQGSGIPQAIAARTMTRFEYRSRLVGFRVAVGKVLLTLFGLLIGASTGREGPTVQVGASIMFMIGKLTPQRQSDLILAGSAAGVAAAFNTPLAGVVFAIEEMSRSFEARASGLIIGAVIIAGLTAQMLLGDYSYFGQTAEIASTPILWLAVPICAVVGGFSGACFSRILIVFPDALPTKLVVWVKAHPVSIAATCGLCVALCSAAVDGGVYGTGYEQARAALQDPRSIPPEYAPLKLLATALSSISGVPGGIFSPSLSVGAGIGALIAPLFHTPATGSIVLLGMVAYFTGVVRAPITAFVIVSEMSGNPRMLVALMATALVADGCARLINSEGVYHALSKRFVNPVAA
jgi:H+/Cl- antiporter ClcA